MAVFRGGFLPELNFDEISYKKTLDKKLGVIIREAARLWLREIITHIPVETGMAKATLQPLGRFLRVAVDVRPKRKPYYSDLEGTVQFDGAGRLRQKFILTDDKSNPLNFIYEFEWSTSVLHYWLEEFYRGAALSGPEAIDAADSVFITYLRTEVNKRIPDLSEFVYFYSEQI